MMKQAWAVMAVAMAALWEATNAQNVFNCGLSGKTPIAYTKGDQTYICFHFMPFKVKLGFLINIDEYTGLEIPDSFKFFENKPPEQLQIHSQLDAYSQYSPAAVYLWKSAKLVVNVMHLVVTLKDGNLVSLNWDNDCYGCNNTATCRQMKTSYLSEKNSTLNLDYKACASPYCVLEEDKKNCNLKVSTGDRRSSSRSRAQTLTATT